MPKYLTTSEFIERSSLKHNNKYDYSKTVYKDVYSKLKIICPVHGEFRQKPIYHLHGAGCTQCGLESRNNSTRYTNTSFMEKAKIIHKNKYSYSKVIYKDTNTKVIITCPEHGDFEQTPGSHLSGARCRKCSQIEVNLKITSTKEEFIEKANMIHFNKYDYSKVSYVNNAVKVRIICPKHGIFKQIPKIHLRGAGCPRCKESKGETLISNLLDKNNIVYIRQFKIPNQIYRFRYDFYLPDYNLLIEFHGVQHYKPVEIFGGVIGFKQTRFRDKFKYSLAIETNYKIVYFNYKDIEKDRLVNIENRLLKILKKIKQQTSRIS